ncbi:MAG TPA: biotin-dependent carboxyltransferase family protein [Methylocella sp.]|nr:biotin-dependent carboxyltransferase family protein [Methylocella sp.]
MLRCGPGTTLQDRGRFGYLRFGVTQSGPMDWASFLTANLALGNDARAAAIEIPTGGVELICEATPLWIAFAGGAFIWRRDGKDLPKAARVKLEPGSLLVARAGDFGSFAYLAIARGFDAPLVMGSRATHLRSGLGGVDGRMLKEGDILTPLASPGGAEGHRCEARIEAPWLARDLAPIRVVPGPQDDFFASETLAAFFSANFALTPRADRMAYKFDGPEIPHSKGHDIVSDGVALGAIQIPGDRKPLVLMADCQPTGGYPKIGHVARADIGRLAQMRPGEICRFMPVSAAEARCALLALENDIAATARSLRPLHPSLTTEWLLSVNLIDGVHNPLKR